MILGLTGFSGAGKSTVAALFKAHGFYHLDCDQLVHDEVYRDPTVLAAISAVFGEDLLQNGQLDRPALRHRVMGKPDALKALNDTVMPFILAHIQRKLEAHQEESVILDAPLLFESGLEKKCHKVLSVVADSNIALARIIERDGLTRPEAERRLASQHPASYYIDRSDYIIKNNEGIPALEKQVLELLKLFHDQTL